MRRGDLEDVVVVVVDCCGLEENLGMMQFVTRHRIRFPNDWIAKDAICDFEDVGELVMGTKVLDLVS